MIDDNTVSMSGTLKTALKKQQQKNKKTKKTKQNKTKKKQTHHSGKTITDEGTQTLMKG